ncbi:hypothetical protein [Sorangium sp. So ce362]|uniref:hypothetical protein n=1 Tax=Sorangium sp. So ce362 TaxID=3133303 RepID=UPI003F5E5ABD
MYLLDFVGEASGLAPEQQRLSQQMIATWSQFARTGDPNRPDLPSWPQFRGGDAPHVQSIVFRPGEAQLFFGLSLWGEQLLHDAAFNTETLETVEGNKVWAIRNNPALPGCCVEWNPPLSFAPIVEVHELVHFQVRTVYQESACTLDGLGQLLNRLFDDHEILRINQELYSTILISYGQLVKNFTLRVRVDSSR